MSPTGTDSFCLQWNGFSSHLSEAFKDIREDKDLFDVTLACEDQQIEAHKLILCACSTYFRSLFKLNPHNHPLLYLRGVKFKELVGILNFIYLGQVSVAEEDLNSFLAVATELKIRGLTQHQTSEATRDKTFFSKKIKTEKENGHGSSNTDIITDSNLLKTEIEISSNGDEHFVTKPPVAFQCIKRIGGIKFYLIKRILVYFRFLFAESGEEELEPIVTIHQQMEEEHVDVDWDNCYADLTLDWNELVEEKMIKRENIWQCLNCDYTTRNRTSLVSHVQGKHIDNFPGYLCKICHGRSLTYCGFEKHMSRQHKYSLARKTTM